MLNKINKTVVLIIFIFLLGFIAGFIFDQQIIQKEKINKITEEKQILGKELKECYIKIYKNSETTKTD